MTIVFNDDVFERLSVSLSDAFSEILVIFYEETESSIQAIQDNIDKKDWNEILNLSHKIISSCKTFGANGMVEVLESIEVTEINNFDQAKKLHEQLNLEYELVKGHIFNKLS